MRIGMMLIGITVLGMMAIGCRETVVVVTATPTVTATPVPTATPAPTATPVPATTATPMPISILERYEDLARRGLVERYKGVWGKDYPCDFTTSPKCELPYLVFHGADGFGVTFAPDFQNPQNKDSEWTYGPNSLRTGYVVIPYGEIPPDRSGSPHGAGAYGYVWAHNYWVYLTQLSRGEAVYWP